MSQRCYACFDTLTAIAIAVFDGQRRLIHENAGFTWLRGERTIDPWQLVLSPRLDVLVSQATGIGGVLHTGMITLGHPEGEPHTLLGTITRIGDELTLIAGHDIAELESLQKKLMGLNESLELLQREVTRSNRELARREETIRQLLHTDVLTGLGNRRRYDEALAAETERAQRYGAPLSLVLVDIDHFKQINDQYGHEAGDQALKAVGIALLRLTRQTDIATRMGGEEFLVFMPGIDAEQAVLAAERIRHGIAELAVPGLPPFTVSAGVATLTADETGAAAVARADAALYQAKHQGRNRVILAAHQASPATS